MGSRKKEGERKNENIEETKKNKLSVEESENQKKWERKRKRIQRAAKKSKCRPTVDKDSNSYLIEKPSTSQISPQVLGKAVKRVQNHLPKTPTKQVPVLSKVIENLSPKKLKQLASELNLELLSKEEIKLRKKRTDALSEEQINNVRLFYKRNDISRILPGKKEYVSVKNVETGKREHIQKHVLIMKIKEAFQLFKRECGFKIGLTMFKILKPPEVFPTSSKDHDVCMCSFHENLEMLIEGLNKVDKTLQITSSVEQLVKETVCSFDVNESKTLMCCMRSCETCGVEKWMERKFIESDIDENSVVSFHQWQRVEGRTVKELVVVDIEQAKEELLSQLKPFSLHVYTTNRQHSEMRTLKEHLKLGETVIHEDFAENYQLNYQNEIMAAHWNTIQATIFTCIIYYKNSDGNLMHINYVVVSDDFNHTKDAVFAFNSAILLHAATLISPISYVHYWSDGCVAQFKNRFNMQNIMMHERDHNIQADWSFFETAHGKGAIDGLGATVKRNVWLAVLRKKYILNTANDFAEAAKKEVPGINMLFVSFEEILQTIQNRKLKQRWEKATPVKGIHRVHFAKPLPSGNLGLWMHSSFSRKEQASYEVEVWTPESVACSSPEEAIPAMHIPSVPLKVNCGDWVAVMYNSDWWPGAVEEVTISFMKPIGENKFMWPAVAEKDTIKMEEILAKLKTSPYPINNRGHFSLINDEVQNVELAIETLGLKKTSEQ